MNEPFELTWHPIETAPKNATSIEVLMHDGTIHKDCHWAEDLSGEDQPPFVGWFIPADKDDPRCVFVGIKPPKAWRLISPTDKTSEGVDG